MPEIVSGSAGHGYDWRAMRSGPAYPDRRVLRKQWNVEKHSAVRQRGVGRGVVAAELQGGVRQRHLRRLRRLRQMGALVRSRAAKSGSRNTRNAAADCDRYRISTGALRLEGRRHVVIPRVGRVRTHENMRKLARHTEKGPERARIRSATIRRRGTRIEIVFAVDIARPQSTNQVSDPASVVGVDVGVRRLATVADADGDILARHPNPRALDCVLDEIRVRGSSPVALCERFAPLPRTHQRTRGAARQRPKHPNQLPAPHHHRSCQEPRHDSGGGCGVVGSGPAEAPAWGAHAPTASCMTPRRGRSGDSSATRPVGTGPSWLSPTSSIRRRRHAQQCGHVQDIGWAATWTCAQCETVHDRDDNAAVNLAAYPRRGDAARCECGCGRSPVGASVKRSPKARPEPATTPLGNGAGTGDEAQDGYSTIRC